jgi:DNA-binding CsgD family transcriptional regulator
MSELLVYEAAIENDPKFDPENITRIYRGEPALVDGDEVQDVLPPRVFEAASYAAQGLSYQAIADIMGCKHSTVKDGVSIAYSRLGVHHNYGLAPYFPLDPNDPILEGKRLSRLKGRHVSLKVLESLSMGLDYKEIAVEHGILHDSVRDRIKDVSNVWPGISGASRVIRVANGLRGRYVRAIEFVSGPVEPADMSQLAFPRLAAIEPAILRRYLGARLH